MTSVEIRQSFLDFFRSKQHTLVPSSTLMPDAPNLLFTNAGMNQFVPIFLGQKAPDVSRWAGAVPGLDTRAADTQKCIRAGGKHNDLEDVGLDTYHHTFFEMLGNWSFGDYFKEEAIAWAWELVTGVWKFPKNRLYATVYKPGPGDPSEFDLEAYKHWERLFVTAGLDPKVHICTGGKQDNFWMMGETGPCGPCSELHVDLTPDGDTQGALVNKGSARCIEIWNLVFIQFNANPDGTFSPLPARHVDTGMGFERVTAIIQNTRGFTDFSRVISNYETDIFRPLFDRLEQVSGQRYGSTLPPAGSQISDLEPQIAADVAFRVIADHIRTLSFSIADGIQPGNTDRQYVLRRILRRAVRYGRSLGLHEPFFYRLVDVLADTMGGVFPEIRARQRHIEEVIRVEEEAFNKTLDRGIDLFGQEVGRLEESAKARCAPRQVPGEFAFTLYDTYGFPLDLTELMARERGLTVDIDGFNRLMDEQRDRARKAQKKQVIELSQLETEAPTRFVGYDTLETPARVLEVVQVKDKTAVVLDASVCYAEMGGQVGDRGELKHGGRLWRVADTQKSGHTWLHLLDRAGDTESGEPDALLPGLDVVVAVETRRREAIQRHHTVTHLLHWALHEVVSRDASQKGSFVGPDKLTFDFNCPPLTPQQVADVEKLVNERILENAPVSWTEVKYNHVKDRQDIMQFFGDKYGEWVRVVQIGGAPTGLDGYSMELCGGTHCRAVGEIGLFRIVAENAIAAGVRRIEAVAGLEAWKRAVEEAALLRAVADKVNAPWTELDKRIDNLLAQQKEIERQLRALAQQQAAGQAKALANRAQAINGVPAIIENLGAADGDTLQGMANELRGLFEGVVVLAGVANGAVALVASVSPQFTAKAQAGKLIQAIAPVVGGRGGGKPDNARGGGKDVGKVDEALAKARALIGE
ncbi:MAG TPA: alanine--tRNA ligase [Verrucomicrobiota bacterium]|nr:alanine--tRNA ligase [Verrucomicrobiota bacterium]HRZ35608.1 alanine--tRNA ligase [Candidatus Paceibacterota bacterium]